MTDQTKIKNLQKKIEEDSALADKIERVSEKCIYLEGDLVVEVDPNHPLHYHVKKEDETGIRFDIRHTQVVSTVLETLDSVYQKRAEKMDRVENLKVLLKEARLDLRLAHKRAHVSMVEVENCLDRIRQLQAQLIELA